MPNEKKAVEQARRNSEKIVAFWTEQLRVVCQDTADALWKFLDQPRTLLRGGEESAVSICKVGNAVLKVSTRSRTGDFVYNVARNTLSCSQPAMTLCIEPATEADLLDALEIVKGGARLHLEEFLRIVRGESEKPLEIKIVNANELARDKVMSIKRNDAGKMTGAVVEHIPA